MKLRNQLLTLSLVTLLVPWAGWKGVQELETFLRTGQEQALLATARTMAQAIPEAELVRMSDGGEDRLHLRQLPARPHLDGYMDDWPGEEFSVAYHSEDHALHLRVWAGEIGGEIYLFCRVHDPDPVREVMGQPWGQSDGLGLLIRSPRGLLSFRIHTAAPGALNLSSQGEAGGQVSGYWLERDDGYQLELVLPSPPGTLEISLGAVDVSPPNEGSVVRREAGTLAEGQPRLWLHLARPQAALSEWLGRVVPPGGRSWVTDADGWVISGSGSSAMTGAEPLSWLERILYRVVAGSRTEFDTQRPARGVRFPGPLVERALADGEASAWSQDPDNAAVRNTVAVPVYFGGTAVGVVVIEVVSDGLLLVTNRALGRIMFAAMILTFALVAGLLWFANRLSRRVQRLSGAVSRAMDTQGRIEELPLTEDRDELGALARNNARLLQAVSDYTAYLQKLAGRLSHELKTPLAMTRSSLENLASESLSPDARRYLERAREGLERQASMVRAMAAATRLEAAIESAEWETIDLTHFLGRCLEGYRTTYPGRLIKIEMPSEPCPHLCAPELLAQALDTLVDTALSLTGNEDTLTLILETEPGGVALKVRNSGSRLPDVLPEQLFDSLVSLRTHGGGQHLGLGLYIVRLVAQAHGGSVMAQNLPAGRGVEFSIRLPA